MLLIARWSNVRDLVDVRRRVIREVASRLFATQCLLTCLSDETILNKHNKQREAQVRRDAQQAIRGIELRLVEFVRVRQPKIEGRGRLRRDIQPVNGACRTRRDRSSNLDLRSSSMSKVASSYTLSGRENHSNPGTHTAT